MSNTPTNGTNMLYVELEYYNQIKDILNGFASFEPHDLTIPVIDIQPQKNFTEQDIIDILSTSKVPYFTENIDLQVANSLNEADGDPKTGGEEYKGIFIDRKTGNFKILSGRFPDKKAMIRKYGVLGKGYIVRKVFERSVFDWIMDNAENPIDSYLMFSTAFSKWKEIDILKKYYRKLIDELPQLFKNIRNQDVITQRQTNKTKNPTAQKTKESKNEIEEAGEPTAAEKHDYTINNATNDQLPVSSIHNEEKLYTITRMDYLNSANNVLDSNEVMLKYKTTADKKYFNAELISELSQAFSMRQDVEKIIVYWRVEKVRDRLFYTTQESQDKKTYLKSDFDNLSVRAYSDDNSFVSPNDDRIYSNTGLTKNFERPKLGTNTAKKYGVWNFFSDEDEMLIETPAFIPVNESNIDQTNLPNYSLVAAFYYLINNLEKPEYEEIVRDYISPIINAYNTSNSSVSKNDYSLIHTLNHYIEECSPKSSKNFNKIVSLCESNKNALSQFDIPNTEILSKVYLNNYAYGRTIKDIWNTHLSSDSDLYKKYKQTIDVKKLGGVTFNIEAVLMLDKIFNSLSDQLKNKTYSYEQASKTKNDLESFSFSLLNSKGEHKEEIDKMSKYYNNLSTAIQNLKPFRDKSQITTAENLRSFAGKLNNFIETCAAYNKQLDAVKSVIATNLDLSDVHGCQHTIPENFINILSQCVDKLKDIEAQEKVPSKEIDALIGRLFQIPDDLINKTNINDIYNDIAKYGFLYEYLLDARQVEKDLKILLMSSELVNVDIDSDKGRFLSNILSKYGKEECAQVIAEYIKVVKYLEKQRKQNSFEDVHLFIVLLKKMLEKLTIDDVEVLKVFAQRIREFSQVEKQQAEQQIIKTIQSPLQDAIENIKNINLPKDYVSMIRRSVENLVNKARQEQIKAMTQDFYEIASQGISKIKAIIDNVLSEGAIKSSSAFKTSNWQNVVEAFVDTFSEEYRTFVENMRKESVNNKMLSDVLRDKNPLWLYNLAETIKTVVKVPINNENDFSGSLLNVSCYLNKFETLDVFAQTDVLENVLSFMKFENILSLPAEQKNSLINMYIALNPRFYSAIQTALMDSSDDVNIKNMDASVKSDKRFYYNIIKEEIHKNKKLKSDFYKSFVQWVERKLQYYNKNQGIQTFELAHDDFDLKKTSDFLTGRRIINQCFTMDVDRDSYDTARKNKPSFYMKQIKNKEFVDYLVGAFNTNPDKNIIMLSFFDDQQSRDNSLKELYTNGYISSKSGVANIIIKKEELFKSCDFYNEDLMKNNMLYILNNVITARPNDKPTGGLYNFFVSGHVNNFAMQVGVYVSQNIVEKNVQKQLSALGDVSDQKAKEIRDQESKKYLIGNKEYEQRMSELFSANEEFVTALKNDLSDDLKSDMIKFMQRVDEQIAIANSDMESNEILYAYKILKPMWDGYLGNTQNNS
jgi:hypothetical protein